MEDIAYPETLVIGFVPSKSPNPADRVPVFAD